jgi:hypothetical protein
MIEHYDERKSSYFVHSIELKKPLPIQIMQIFYLIQIIAKQNPINRKTMLIAT